MGCVQQAVLEFDEEVRAPWRPRLVSGSTVEGPHRRPVAASRRRAAARRGWGSAPPLPASGGRSTPGRARAAPWRAPVGRGRPAPHGPTAGGPPAGHVRLRLTRRARRLAVVLALARRCGPRLLARAAARPVADEGLHLAGVSSVVVQPGDTLWSIAVVAGRRRRRARRDRPASRSSTGSGCDLVPGSGAAAPMSTGRPQEEFAQVGTSPARRVRAAGDGPGRLAPRDAAAEHPQRRAADFVNPQYGRVHPLCADPTHTVVACQAPWRTEQLCSPASRRPSRSIRRAPGGPVSCSAGGTPPTVRARCGSASSSAVSRRPRGPISRRCACPSVTSPWRPSRPRSSPRTRSCRWRATRPRDASTGRLRPVRHCHRRWSGT